MTRQLEFPFASQPAPAAGEILPWSARTYRVYRSPGGDWNAITIEASGLSWDDARARCEQLEREFAAAHPEIRISSWRADLFFPELEGAAVYCVMDAAGLVVVGGLSQKAAREQLGEFYRENSRCGYYTQLEGWRK